MQSKSKGLNKDFMQSYKVDDIATAAKKETKGEEKASIGKSDTL